MSLLLLLGGDTAETELTISRIAVQHEYPPDELAVRIEPSSGPPTRLAADEWRPENVLDNLECHDEMPGGDKECRFSLARDPRAPQSDLAPFSKGTVYGPGGEVVWGPGRLGKTAPVEGDAPSIVVELEGNSTELEDNKALKLGFIDSGFGRWREMSTARRKFLGELGYLLTGVETNTGWQDKGSAAPGIVMSFAEKVAEKKLIAEMWFDGGGPDIGALLGDFESLAGATENKTFDDFLFLAADDANGAQDVSADFDQKTQSQQRVDATVSGRRYAGVSAQYNSAAGAFSFTNNVHAFLNLRVLSWLATQNLALQGTWPEVGYTARQMLEYAITNLTGLKFDAESEDDGYIIPQAWWSDHTTLAAVVQELTRYGLLDWMVFGDTFSLRKPGTYGEKWKLYSGSAEFQEDGEDTARSWRKITVAWPDPDGTTKTVGPPGSGADYISTELEITDPDHPAVRADKDRHDVLVLKAGYEGLAIGAGKRWLVEANELRHSGSCSVSGWAQSAKGVWKPVSQMRAADLVSRADSGDPSYRKVTSRAYSHPNRQARLALDAPPEGLQALLERYDADLISLGSS